MKTIFISKFVLQILKNILSKCRVNFHNEILLQIHVNILVKLLSTYVIEHLRSGIKIGLFQKSSANFYNAQHSTLKPSKKKNQKSGFILLVKNPDLKQYFCHFCLSFFVNFCDFCHFCQFLSLLSFRCLSIFINFANFLTAICFAIAVLQVTILRIDFSVLCLHIARHFSFHGIRNEIISQWWEFIFLSFLLY